MIALLAVSLTLVAPVPGPVAREFAYGADPFRAGWHRGADFFAAPGSAVRAACSGRVAWAGRDVVTVRCGGFRVTHLPLTNVAVARGAQVRGGARIGTLGRSRDHAGLHVGVRRAGDRFGYVDPVPLLAEPPRGVPAVPRVSRPPRAAPRVVPEPRPRTAAPLRAAPRPRTAPPLRAAPRPRTAPPLRAAPRPRTAPPLRAAPRPRTAPPLRAAPRPRTTPPLRAAPRPGSPARPLPAGPAPAAVRVLAPWPAWLGLAVLLAGAVGGGVRIGLRRRRATAAVLARR